MYNEFVYYVYILRSVSNTKQTYVGFTKDLRKRIQAHNLGIVPHTKKFIPWEIETYLAFRDKYLALDFEVYLKKGSGKAFLNKRLIKN